METRESCTCRHAFHMVLLPWHGVDNQDHVMANKIGDIRNGNIQVDTLRVTFEVVDPALHFFLLDHVAFAEWDDV